MKSLLSFFSCRLATRATISAKQPVVLSADALKRVSGGLPRVSDPMPTDDASIVAAPLPRVS